MSSVEYQFASHLFNPVFWHIRNALHDDDLRFVFVFGGSSSSKTHSLVQEISIELAEQGASTMVLRKFGVDIDDSIYADFKGIGSDLKLENNFQYQKHLIKKGNSKIRFRGLDDSEKLKGLSQYKYLLYNELTQFDEADYDQGRKRLRGRPGQKIIADWNPITEKHWIKTNVLDKEEWIDQPLFAEGAPTKYCVLDAEHSFVKKNARGNMLLIKTTYKDNYWVVGHPDKPERGFFDKHTIEDFESDKINKPNYYRIYGLGNWGVIKTGGEFWKQFDEMKHCKPLSYNGTPIHISVDSNVRPYVTISLWHLHLYDKELLQFHELPCKAPDNNAPKAARKLAEYLRKIGYDDVLHVYGDPAGNAESTVDEDSKGFLMKFLEELKKQGIKTINKVQKSHARVAMSGAFINDIYEGLLDWKIFIGNHCSTSIDDYNSVQEDENGGMAKIKVKDPATGKTYELHGHFSDAKRYFITTVLKDEYNKYVGKNKNKPVGNWAGAFG